MNCVLQATTMIVQDVKAVHTFSHFLDPGWNKFVISQGCGMCVSYDYALCMFYKFQFSA